VTKPLYFRKHQRENVTVELHRHVATALLKDVSVDYWICVDSIDKRYSTVLYYEGTQLITPRDVWLRTDRLHYTIVDACRKDLL